ncbi:hypothetical protein F2Q69_00031643 [Brassica cretica]|uniref:Uncharacterized protein n=1 Tax=Brassica cretica TaxID=69181 RepID=A0A8S9S0S4_BRACR|nr:hypothetical protein F2Q69_00031643 [Brassica cretica]
MNLRKLLSTSVFLSCTVSPSVSVSTPTTTATSAADDTEPEVETSGTTTSPEPSTPAEPSPTTEDTVSLPLRKGCRSRKPPHGILLTIMLIVLGSQTIIVPILLP